IELSERLPTLAAPRRPERHDDEIAAILGEPQVLSVSRLEREIKRCRAYCGRRPRDERERNDACQHGGEQRGRVQPLGKTGAITALATQRKSNHKPATPLSWVQPRRPVALRPRLST